MSRNLIITLCLIGIATFFITSSSRRQQLRADTIKEENAVFVTISDMDCYVYKGISAVYFRRNGSSHEVNMRRYLCTQFSVGQQIKVYYNAAHDIYFMKNDGRETDEEFGMDAGILLLIASLGYLFWLFFFKKYFAQLKAYWKIWRE